MPRDFRPAFVRQQDKRRSRAREADNRVDLAGATRANRLKFTPDGKLVIVSELGGGGGGLVFLDAGTRSVKQRLRLGGASGILIPPDGSRAYVALTGANAVAVIDLKELKEIDRLKTGSGPDGMAWLPAKPQ